MKYILFFILSLSYILYSQERIYIQNHNKFTAKSLVQTSALEGFYVFSDDNGDSTRDQSGNNRHFTQVGFESPISGAMAGLDYLTDGESALVFDGSDDNLTLTNAYNPGTASFTIWTVARTNGTPASNEDVIFSKQAFFGNIGYMIYWTEANSVGLQITDGTNTVQKAVTLTGATKYFLGFTIDQSANELKMYVNGVVQGAAVDITAVGSVSNSAAHTVGDRGAGGRDWLGQIAHLGYRSDLIAADTMLVMYAKSDSAFSKNNGYARDNFKSHQGGTNDTIYYALPDNVNTSFTLTYTDTAASATTLRVGILHDTFTQYGTFSASTTTTLRTVTISEPFNADSLAFITTGTAYWDGISIVVNPLGDQTRPERITRITRTTR